MTKQITDSLFSFFKLSNARLVLIAQIIQGLVLASTVNLTRLSTTLSGKILDQSKYRKLQRFFAEVSLDQAQLARFLLNFLDLQDQKWDLALDRTNWNYGKIPINILTLAIVNKDSGTPIFWKILPKKGNSNTKERLELIDKFLAVFPKDKINNLFCDREFIGLDWIQGLINRDVPFCIRIRENIKIYCPKGKPINKGIRRLDRGCSIVFSGKYQMKDKSGFQGKNVSVFAHRRREDGELIVLITNGDAYRALEEYAKRWGIEVIFGNLKSRGFEMEETHLYDPDRISTMLALLSIAYVWALKTGQWRSLKVPIKFKKHGRKAISIFRYGLDWLRKIFYQTKEFSKELIDILNLFPSNPLTDKRLC